MTPIPIEEKADHSPLKTKRHCSIALLTSSGDVTVAGMRHPRESQAKIAQPSAYSQQSLWWGVWQRSQLTVSSSASTGVPQIGQFGAFSWAMSSLLFILFICFVTQGGNLANKLLGFVLAAEVPENDRVLFSHDESEVGLEGWIVFFDDCQ